jgi:hypothetical protein
MMLLAADVMMLLVDISVQAFERLFESSSGKRHILTWFGRFNASGGGEAGAAALTSYALSHRGQYVALLHAATIDSVLCDWPAT